MKFKSDEEIYKAFGEKIKKLRSERKLTQIELSKVLGVTQSTIVAIEKGQRKIPLSMLSAFAEYFGMTVDELVDTEIPAAERKEEKDLMHQCGNQLKSIREANNLTISEFANEFHISEELYSSYENGTKQIPLNILINFAKHYNVSIDKIFGLNIEKDQSDTFITTDKTASDRYEKLTKYIRFNQFNDEEIDKLMTFAKFLIYERNQ